MTTFSRSSPTGGKSLLVVGAAYGISWSVEFERNKSTRRLGVFLRIACKCLERALPLKVTADILCEFMEVAFHLILYVREVYPPGKFTNALYN